MAELLLGPLAMVLEGQYLDEVPYTYSSMRRRPIRRLAPQKGTLGDPMLPPQPEPNLNPNPNPNPYQVPYTYEKETLALPFPRASMHGRARLPNPHPHQAESASTRHTTRGPAYSAASSPTRGARGGGSHCLSRTLPA